MLDETSPTDLSAIADRLAGHALFKGVDRVDREALIRVMERRHFPKGTVLFHKGDPGSSMYIILRGKVRVYTEDAEGNEFTIRYLSEMFGEFSMLDERPRSASVVAAEDLDVLILHRDDFTRYLREHPMVGLAMMRNLVERVRYTTTYLQRVVEATRQLATGHYDLGMGGAPEAETDAEIQALIQAFVQMVQQVQTRELALRHVLEADQPSAGSEDGFLG